MVNNIQVKSILNKHKKRDDWFLDDYSVNPYSGCSFNCIYCYIRGSKYGENMAKTLSIKINAPELLEKQLSRRAKKEEYGIIALSSSTEPYMPIEEKLKLTGKLLEIILKYKFPVEIATKSKLVLRDFDILKEIDKKAILPADLKPELKHGVIISFSISTLDEKLTKILEPGAPKPIERLETMKKCKEEGFFTGICFIPVLPFLSDSEEQLDKTIRTVKEYGADFIFVGGLTLFGKGSADCKTLYYKFLDKHYPELVSKYRSLYRIFFAPSKEYQKELEEKSKRLCEKYGIKNKII
ncbi:MAG TPA: radical SAM protein [Caldisericia bacterium]|nr:radical SAM protein [Caldisericia bacterium]HPB33202.1 radical SAM protein [Caldisericia bacterium]HQL66707.1 radical SAM protein [Caldisericia bacterium]HQN47976.1 radical SAM protein [Caldisericia bacterium]HQO99060.1 radical SAM protein [Caldisericia bacterium]